MHERYGDLVEKLGNDMPLNKARLKELDFRRKLIFAPDSPIEYEEGVLVEDVPFLTNPDERILDLYEDLMMPLLNDRIGFYFLISEIGNIKANHTFLARYRKCVETLKMLRIQPGQVRMYRGQILTPDKNQITNNTSLSIIPLEY